jgi:hypothetical protein
MQWMKKIHFPVPKPQLEDKFYPGMSLKQKILDIRTLIICNEVVLRAKTESLSVKVS